MRSKEHRLSQTFRIRTEPRGTGTRAGMSQRRQLIQMCLWVQVHNKDIHLPKSCGAMKS
jgi:hypothetical protein